MSIIALGAPTAVGNALIPPEGPSAIPLTLDFTEEPNYTINVGDFMQKGPGYPGLSVLQTVYADLAGAEAALVISVVATGQRLVIPPKTQGYYPIISPSRDSISFACADDNAVIPVHLINVPVPPNSWSTVQITAGISDAPADGNEYVRENGGWVELSQSGAGGIADAPNDNSGYVRKNNAWVRQPIQVDAASDGNQYARQNGGWAQVVASSGGGDSGGGGDNGGGTSPPPTEGTTSNKNGLGYHKYWVMGVTNMPGGGYGVGELQMFDDDGNALCKGTQSTPGAQPGTAIGEGTYNGGAQFGPASCFDGSLDSFWCGTSDPAYVGWQFNTPVNVASMIATNRNTSDGYGAAFPGGYQIMYSDDGNTWTNANAGAFGDDTSEKAWTIDVT